MNQNAYQHELNKGLWLLSPHIAANYIKASSKSLEFNADLLIDKSIEATSVREVVDEDGMLVDISQQDIPQGSIGIVRTIGSMYKYGGWFHWGTDELVAMAKRFDEDSRIIGQVWLDDSGGGTVSSVAPWLDFLSKKKKPVIALVDTCGSANYWKNCGADFVMAENNTSSMIGSIGVMLQLYDYKKMFEDMGIVEHIIESSLSDDKNKAFKLALEGKYELIREEFLDPLALKFQNDVKAARPNLKNAEESLRGKMFYAEEAQSIGLIDGIGNIDAAIDYVKFLASARSFISTNV